MAQRGETVESSITGERMIFIETVRDTNGELLVFEDRALPFPSSYSYTAILHRATSSSGADEGSLLQERTQRFFEPVEILEEAAGYCITSRRPQPSARLQLRRAKGEWVNFPAHCCKSPLHRGDQELKSVDLFYPTGHPSKRQAASQNIHS